MKPINRATNLRIARRVQTGPQAASVGNRAPPTTRESCMLRASAIARRRTEKERAEAFFLRE